MTISNPDPPETNHAPARRLVHIDGATLTFGAVTVLEDVHFEVREGQIVFFLGRNGTGKTTLIRAILGEIEPNAGSVRLLCDRSEVGFVPQESQLNRNLPTTIKEFVGLGLVATDVAKGAAGERLEWALRHTSLSGLEDASYWSLSGGQRQRASIARALIRRPRLLILDEPTSNLDIAAERAIIELVEELKSTHGITTICVSHKLELAQRSATDVALFGDSRVRFGTAADLLRGDVLDSLFAELHCSGVAS